MPLSINGITFLSNSSLTSMGCSTKALLRNHFLFTPQDANTEAADAGRAIHHALATYYGDADRTTAKQAALTALADSYADLIITQDRLQLGNVRDILETYFDTPQAHSLTALSPEHVEYDFCLPLTPDGRIAYFGSLDIIGIHANTGVMTVTDHKTTGQLTQHWLNAFTMSSQLSSYIWVARYLFDPHLTACTINAIEIRALPMSTKKCRIHGIPYDQCRLMHTRFAQATYARTPAQIDEWQATAVTLAQRYQALTKDVTLTQLDSWSKEGSFAEKACEFCPYTPLCTHAITPAAIASHYDTRDPVPRSFLPMFANYLERYA
jgi:hypothetical protein